MGTIVKAAISQGYALVDTAEWYGNEDGVGLGIKEAGVKREDGRYYTKRDLGKSLGKLQLEYVDLYLIHHPMDGRILETYDVMQEMKKEGKIRSVGVSNFGVHHLRALEEAGRVLPSVNQLELHPWQQKKDIVAYCREKGITVMAYSPLVKGGRMNDPTLLGIAKKYGKTPGQVLIRWSIEHGFICIPKTGNVARLSENAAVFDWKLEPSDMKILDAMPDESCTWNPTTSPWEG